MPGSSTCPIWARRSSSPGVPNAAYQTPDTGPAIQLIPGAPTPDPDPDPDDKPRGFWGSLFKKRK